MVRMKNRQRITRRSVLLSCAGFGVAACGAWPDLSCAGKGQLTRSQQTSRDGRSYRERSRIAGRSCINCTFFNAPDGGCGVCAIDNLPANPEGHCISWASLTAETSDQRVKGVRRA